MKKEEREFLEYFCGELIARSSAFGDEEVEEVTPLAGDASLRG